MRPTSLLTPLMLCATLGAVAQDAGVTTPPAAAAEESIRQEHLRADLFFLASDSMRGRLTGTAENRLAAEWIRSRFERAGLEPAGTDGSFFHKFNLMAATLGGDNQLTVSRGRSARTVYRQGRDMFPLRFSASGRTRAPVVFAGFGISAPALGHDDVPRDAVKDRIVLVLDHEPGELDPDSVFDGVVMSEYSVTLRKTLAAQSRGAAGILFVDDVHNHPNQSAFETTASGYWPQEAPRIERHTLADWAERVDIPAVQISPALAQSLLSGTGKSLAELGRAADTKAGSEPLVLPDVIIEMTTAVERRSEPDRNVIASLEGSDSALAEEWVVVGAHYDHEGTDGSRIYNGADDDGLGVVALLAIADAFAKEARAGHRPKRSVLFGAWNSEERGLLGAWAFTEAPTVPLDRIAAALNLDMIGRNEEVPAGGGYRFQGLDPQTARSNANAVNIIGTTRSAGLKAAVERANENIGLTLKLRYDNNASNLMRRSDHWPFLQRGVPAIWFHTGLHPDYHTPDDRPETVNYEKLERVARLAYRTAWVVADQPERPGLASPAVGQ